MHKSKAEEDQNSLLSALPSDELQRLDHYLDSVVLKRNQVLYEWGEPLTNVYFPINALVSLIWNAESGGTCEVGVIGREGMVGLPAFLGSNLMTGRTVVQIAGKAARINTNILKTEFERGEQLQKILLLYNHALFTQVVQTAVYTNLYHIEARLARWLLLVQDCTQTSQLPLTQESIASMLGVRRASVSEAIASLRNAGIVKHFRGQITIIDQRALEVRAGDSYALFKSEREQMTAAKI